MAVGQSRSGGEQQDHERAQEHNQPPQSSSHSGYPRRPRPYIKGLPADPAALSALWPEVEPWLMGSLLKRGVDHATAKDACQEVAFRLLTKQKRFESAEHFYRWVNKVAHNLVSKWQRKDARVSVEDVPEGSSPDVVSTVEPRVVLEVAKAAFDSLSEADRRALTTALRWEQRGRTKRERDRVSLQVLRARRRLRDRLEGWLAGLSWWRWPWSSDPVPLTVASQAAVSAAAVVALLSGWLLPHAAHKPRRLAPISTSVVGQAAAVTHEAGRTAPVHSTHHPTSSETKTAAAASPEQPPTPSPWHQRVVVVPPADAPGTTETATNPRDPKDNALICWGNVPHVPDSCIAHPLRRNDGWITPQP